MPEHKRLNVKRHLWIVGGLALSCVAAWALFAVFGEAMISAMYEGKSFSWLNAAISGQQEHDVNHYLALASEKLRTITVYLFVGYFIFLVLDAIRAFIGLARFFVPILSAFILAELCFLLFLKQPFLIKNIPGIFSQVNYYYRNFQRDLIQLNPQFSEYDPELTYLLKPGEFYFENQEFRNKYNVNKAGLRDDAASLDSPKIIAAGDSYTMGWGVEQEEGYPQLLEKKTKMRVLNAGISSYGTVRELQVLDRLDLSNMKYLIIQYNVTDAYENRTYLERDYKLPITSEDKYVERASRFQAKRRYFPGKMTWEISKSLFGLNEDKYERSSSHVEVSTEVRDFLRVLQVLGEEKLEGVQILFFELPFWCETRSSFVTSVRNEIKSESSYPDYMKEMRVIDFHGKLQSDEHCFVLDDHMNSRGHALVADTLAKVIASLEESELVRN